MGTCEQESKVNLKDMHIFAIIFVTKMCSFFIYFFASFSTMYSALKQICMSMVSGFKQAMCSRILQSCFSCAAFL